MADAREAFAFQTSDYDPASGPTELASWSRSVLTGRLADVAEGRTFTPDESPATHFSTMVLVVEPQRWVKGQPDEGQGDLVYVEVDAPPTRPGVDPADQRETLFPPDTMLALYLVEARPGGGDIPAVDPSAGRPEGQPLWSPVNPQGLVVSADGRTAALYTGRVTASGLAEFLPPSTAFPGAR